MTQDMSGDRELLELAAMAAGFQNYIDDVDRYGVAALYVRDDGIFVGTWSPLSDDGDALRLAVKLRLRINREINCGCDIVEVFGPEADDMSCHCTTEGVVDDPYEITRRAIVRAAAEIGKGIPQPAIEGVPEDNYYKTQAEAEECGRAAAEIGRKMDGGAE